MPFLLALPSQPNGANAIRRSASATQRPVDCRKDAARLRKLPRMHAGQGERHPTHTSSMLTELVSELGQQFDTVCPVVRSVSATKVYSGGHWFGTAHSKSLTGATRPWLRESGKVNECGTQGHPAGYGTVTLRKEQEDCVSLWRPPSA